MILTYSITLITSATLTNPKLKAQNLKQILLRIYDFEF